MSTTYIKGSDLPDLVVAWYDGDGTTIDMSSGYTFAVKVGIPGADAELTKSTGITGTSSGLSIQWATSGELNDLDAGIYTLQVTATRTADSRNRIQQIPLHVLDAVT